MSTRIPVQLDRNTPQQTRLATQADLYEAVVKFLGDRLHTKIPLDVLVQRTITYEDGVKVLAKDADPDDPRAITSNQPRHELRLGKLPLSEVGFVGKINLVDLEGAILYIYNSIAESLKSEQPGCNWQLVAALVSQVDLRKTVAVPYSGRTFNEMSWMSHPAVTTDGDSGPVPWNQKTDHVVMPDFRCVALMVFADVGRGQLRDPHAEHATGPQLTGPMTEYRTTRNLLVLSYSQQARREQCEEIIAEFAQSQQTAIVSTADDFEEVQKLRARVAELEAEKGALAKPKAPPEPPGSRRGQTSRKPKAKNEDTELMRRVVGDAVSSASAEQARVIVNLREQGFTPDAIADSLQLPIEQVTEAIRAAAESAS